MRDFLHDNFKCLSCKTSIIRRRAGNLDIKLKAIKNIEKIPTDLVIDSTGLKIFGETDHRNKISISLTFSVLIENNGYSLCPSLVA